GDLPLDEVGVGKDVREEPEIGDDGGAAEVVGLVREQLDLEHLTRLGALHVHRPGQRVAEPAVHVRHVRVGALARELSAETLLGLQTQLLPRRALGDRLEVRVPAVVHQRSSATRAAAALQAAISSSVQRLGRPSWCNETIARTTPLVVTGVTIWAARPP